MLLSFRSMDEQTNTKHSNEIFEAVKKETGLKSSENNPWHMTSISDFLFYCCVECNFKDKNEENFILHAKAHHPKFLEMFVNNKDLVLPKSDLKEEDFVTCIFIIRSIRNSFLFYDHINNEHFPNMV